MRVYIRKEQGIWQLCGELKQILLECKATCDTRYALNGVHISKGCFVASDGSRLVEIKRNHKIPAGDYFVTPGGWLIKPKESEKSFLMYRDIITDLKKSRLIVDAGPTNGRLVIGMIFGGLFSVGFPFAYDLYKKPIEILSKTISGHVKVYVDKVAPAEWPFLIDADLTFGTMRYVQMPVNLNAAANKAPAIKKPPRPLKKAEVINV